jgi:hypothetical protein
MIYYNDVQVKMIYYNDVQVKMVYYDDVQVKMAGDLKFLLLFQTKNY